MSDYGIDAKPKVRALSARLNRRNAALGKSTLTSPPSEPPDQDDQVANDLHVRVKDRSGDDVISHKKGGFFKETQMKLFKDAEGLKRPLTGIFRRPGSRAGRKREEEDDKDKDTLLTVQGVGDRSISPVLSASHPMVMSNPRPMDYDPIARAPKMSSSQLHNLLQVDQLALKHPHLSRLDDLDISLLSRSLCDQEEIKDDDIPWTWDHLFASISAELREEWSNEDHDDR